MKVKKGNLFGVSRYFLIVLLTFFGMLTIFGTGNQEVRPISYPNPSSLPEVKHRYTLKFMDIDGNPIEGVAVEYELFSRGSPDKRGTFVTSSDGYYKETIVAIADVTGANPSNITYKSA